MKELINLNKALKEAYLETTNQSEKLKDSGNYIAREYFLGREAGLKYAIALIESYINDKTPWEE